MMIHHCVVMAFFCALVFSISLNHEVNALAGNKFKVSGSKFSNANVLINFDNQGSFTFTVCSRKLCDYTQKNN